MAKIWIEIRDESQGVVSVIKPVEDKELAMRWIYNTLQNLSTIAPGIQRAQVTIGTIYP
jgi:hypothetical protein